VRANGRDAHRATGGDEAPGGRWVLRLYVTGLTPRSVQAIANLRAICDEHLAGRYELEVIDIYQNPEATRHEQIVAAPTLVKSLPPPRTARCGASSRRPATRSRPSGAATSTRWW
jgi:circadian clock protein KaiB